MGWRRRAGLLGRLPFRSVKTPALDDLYQDRKAAFDPMSHRGPAS